MNGSNKVVASGFGGNATRFKKAEDQKLIASIDVYESDFGQVQLVPHRLIDNRVLGLDTDYVEIGYLQPMRNVPLAKTGHSDRRMVSTEWGVIVGNEKAHFQIADLS
jgi:hypothetical protein